jgi:cellulose synthase/poly-beta-1,6-N-acetylglucosamine synthase-like glycosyltransferase
MPDISGILPTRNRAHLLPFVLEALRHQALCKSRFEIIAVNDGSTDQTQSILEQASSDLPIRVFYQRHAGIAAAKNLGIFASRSETLLFLDDDDAADPDLLAAHLVAHKRHPESCIAILGHTRVAPDVARSPLMHHVTQVGCQLYSYGHMQPGKSLDYTAFWGGRSSCKRSLLVSHGIFNPVFTFGCEDIELGWRLAAAVGLRVIYEPAACTAMIRTLSFRDFCARQQRQGRSQWRFAELHPRAQVRSYCEIDQGLNVWRAHAGRFTQFLRYVGRLDQLATVRANAGLSMEPKFQMALDDAYCAAFSLCRAKGIAMESSLQGPRG